MEKIYNESRPIARNIVILIRSIPLALILSYYFYKL